MKIKRNGNYINFAETVKKYRNELKSSETVIINTLDHLEHICAYIAWKEVGGNIFLQSPLTPQVHKDYFANLIPTLDYQNTVLIPTSGTTKMPKIIANNRDYYNNIANISKDWLAWNKDSVFINFVPAPTSGFWHAFMPAVVATDSEIVLGSLDNLHADLNEQGSHMVMVPGMIDMLRTRNIDVNLSKYDTFAVGSAPVLTRHVDFIFDKGCKEFTHLYGITEGGVPSLRNKTSVACDDSRCLQHTNEYGIETKLDKDGELLIKGSTLCSNIEELGTDNGWYRTGDLFETIGNNIRFVGRTNDIIKVNGYKTNLLNIEHTIEDISGISECIAIIHNRLGVDWIEIQYVGTISNITTLKKHLSNMLPVHSMPRKFSKVDAVPRNTLNKKIRNTS